MDLDLRLEVGDDDFLGFGQSLHLMKMFGHLGQLLLVVSYDMFYLLLLFRH